MEKIKIVLVGSNQEQVIDQKIKREHEDIQTFFDENNYSFKKDTVNFIIMRGIYDHNERKMMITGVFINKTKQPIYGKGFLNLIYVRVKRKSALLKLHLNYQHLA